MKVVGFTTNNYDDESQILGDDEHQAAWKATVDYMKQHGLKFNGFYHKDGDFGTPYFDNGKRLLVGQRAWGHMIADVLDYPNTSDRYVDWAFRCDEVSVYPDPHAEILKAEQECKHLQEIMQLALSQNNIADFKIVQNRMEKIKLRISYLKEKYK